MKKITLDEVLDVYPGRMYEGYAVILCPFHPDHHPSMRINEMGFRCWSCGAHGPLSLLMGGNSRGASQAQSDPAPFVWGKWMKQYHRLDRFCDDAHKLLECCPSQGWYFKQRHFSHLIKELGLGWHEGWNIIPCKNEDGTVVSAIARASDEDAMGTRYMISTGAGRILYCPSWERILANKINPVYVTFGIFDAMALYDLGLPVLGVAGKSIDSEQFVNIRRKIIIIPDRDEEKDAYKLASFLGWRGNVKVLDYPEGMKDPSDVYTKLGKQGLRELL